MGSKKNKNTYVVKITPHLNEQFSLCNETPLAVVKLNGKPVQEDAGWMRTTHFPNPATTTMVEMYDELKPIMGESLASTIIEYQDKETKHPIALLFPTNEMLARCNSVEELTQRLNHATRHDLERQIKIRNKYLSMLSMKNKEKAK